MEKKVKVIVLRTAGTNCDAAVNLIVNHWERFIPAS
jgi:hypothetical protein